MEVSKFNGKSLTVSDVYNCIQNSQQNTYAMALKLFKGIVTTTIHCFAYANRVGDKNTNISDLIRAYSRFIKNETGGYFDTLVTQFGTVNVNNIVDYGAARNIVERLLTGTELSQLKFNANAYITIANVYMTFLDMAYLLITRALQANVYAAVVPNHYDSFITIPQLNLSVYQYENTYTLFKIQTPRELSRKANTFEVPGNLLTNLGAVPGNILSTVMSQAVTVGIQTIAQTISTADSAPVNMSEISKITASIRTSSTSGTVVNNGTISTPQTLYATALETPKAGYAYSWKIGNSVVSTDATYQIPTKHGKYAISMIISEGTIMSAPVVINVDISNVSIAVTKSTIPISNGAAIVSGGTFTAVPSNTLSTPTYSWHFGDTDLNVSIATCTVPLRSIGRLSVTVTDVDTDAPQTWYCDLVPPPFELTVVRNLASPATPVSLADGDEFELSTTNTLVASTTGAFSTVVYVWTLNGTVQIDATTSFTVPVSHGKSIVTVTATDSANSSITQVFFATFPNLDLALKTRVNSQDIVPTTISCGSVLKVVASTLETNAIGNLTYEWSIPGTTFHGNSSTFTVPDLHNNSNDAKYVNVVVTDGANGKYEAEVQIDPLVLDATFSIENAMLENDFVISCDQTVVANVSGAIGEVTCDWLILGVVCGSGLSFTVPKLHAPLDAESSMLTLTVVISDISAKFEKEYTVAPLVMAFKTLKYNNEVVDLSAFPQSLNAQDDVEVEIQDFVGTCHYAWSVTGTNYGGTEPSFNVPSVVGGGTLNFQATDDAGAILTFSVAIAPVGSLSATYTVDTIEITESTVNSGKTIQSVVTGYYGHIRYSWSIAGTSYGGSNSSFTVPLVHQIGMDPYVLSFSAIDDDNATVSHTFTIVPLDLDFTCTNANNTVHEFVQGGPQIQYVHCGDILETIVTGSVGKVEYLWSLIRVNSTAEYIGTESSFTVPIVHVDTDDTLMVAVSDNGQVVTRQYALAPTEPLVVNCYAYGDDLKLPFSETNLLTCGTQVAVEILNSVGTVTYEWSIAGVTLGSPTLETFTVPDLHGTHVLRLLVSDDGYSVLTSIPISTKKLSISAEVANSSSGDATWISSGAVVTYTADSSTVLGTLSWKWYVESNLDTTLSTSTEFPLIANMPTLHSAAEVKLVVTDTYAYGEESVTVSFMVYGDLDPISARLSKYTSSEQQFTDYDFMMDTLNGGSNILGIVVPCDTEISASRLAVAVTNFERQLREKQVTLEIISSNDTILPYLRDSCSSVGETNGFKYLKIGNYSTLKSTHIPFQIKVSVSDGYDTNSSGSGMPCFMSIFERIYNVTNPLVISVTDGTYEIPSGSETYPILIPAGRSVICNVLNSLGSTLFHWSFVTLNDADLTTPLWFNINGGTLIMGKTRYPKSISVIADDTRDSETNLVPGANDFESSFTASFTVCVAPNFNTLPLVNVVGDTYSHVVDLIATGVGRIYASADMSTVVGDNSDIKYVWKLGDIAITTAKSALESDDFTTLSVGSQNELYIPRTTDQIDVSVDVTDVDGTTVNSAVTLSPNDIVLDFKLGSVAIQNGAQISTIDTLYMNSSASVAGVFGTPIFSWKSQVGNALPISLLDSSATQYFFSMLRAYGSYSLIASLTDDADGYTKSGTFEVDIPLQVSVTASTAPANNTALDYSISANSPTTAPSQSCAYPCTLTASHGDALDVLSISWEDGSNNTVATSFNTGRRSTQTTVTLIVSDPTGYTTDGKTLATLNSTPIPMSVAIPIVIAVNNLVASFRDQEITPGIIAANSTISGTSGLAVSSIQHLFGTASYLWKTATYGGSTYIEGAATESSYVPVNLYGKYGLRSVVTDSHDNENVATDFTVDIDIKMKVIVGITGGLVVYDNTGAIVSNSSVYAPLQLRLATGTLPFGDVSNISYVLSWSDANGENAISTSVNADTVELYTIGAACPHRRMKQLVCSVRSSVGYTTDGISAVTTDSINDLYVVSSPVIPVDIPFMIIAYILNLTLYAPTDQAGDYPTITDPSQIYISVQDCQNVFGSLTFAWASADPRNSTPSFMPITTGSTLDTPVLIYGQYLLRSTPTDSADGSQTQAFFNVAIEWLFSVNDFSMADLTQSSISSSPLVALPSFVPPSDVTPFSYAWTIGIDVHSNTDTFIPTVRTGTVNLALTGPYSYDGRNYEEKTLSSDISFSILNYSYNVVAGAESMTAYYGLSPVAMSIVSGTSVSMTTNNPILPKYNWGYILGSDISIIQFYANDIQKSANISVTDVENANGQNPPESTLTIGAIVGSSSVGMLVTNAAYINKTADTSVNITFTGFSTDLNRFKWIISRYILGIPETTFGISGTLILTRDVNVPNNTLDYSSFQNDNITGGNVYTISAAAVDVINGETTCELVPSTLSIDYESSNLTACHLMQITANIVVKNNGSPLLSDSVTPTACYVHIVNGVNDVAEMVNFSVGSSFIYNDSGPVTIYVLLEYNGFSAITNSVTTTLNSGANIVFQTSIA